MAGAGTCGHVHQRMCCSHTGWQAQHMHGTFCGAAVQAGSRTLAARRQRGTQPPLHHSRIHAWHRPTEMLAQADIAAGDMIHRVVGVDDARRQHLIDLLDIDLDWRLNKVSDGQRRRVQICMGLLKPYQVPSSKYPAEGRHRLFQCACMTTGQACRLPSAAGLAAWSLKSACLVS